MIKLGNIICNEPLVNHNRVEYINYVNSSDDFDKSLPSLYVGWNYFKIQKETNLETILNKEYEKYKIYWEYSFNENKAEHITGVQLFTINSPYYYFWTNYDYRNIDPIFYNIESIDKLLEVIPKNFDLTYNYKNEMLYGISGVNVYGIHIKMYEYFKLDIDVFMNNIKEISSRHIDDVEGLEYQKYYKILPQFDDLKRYMVVFLSKA